VSERNKGTEKMAEISQYSVIAQKFRCFSRQGSKVEKHISKWFRHDCGTVTENFFIIHINFAEA
jgi:hypothetical protein